VRSVVLLELVQISQQRHHLHIKRGSKLST
jgi:hypothetical protein